MEEPETVNLLVVGSNPTLGANLSKRFHRTRVNRFQALKQIKAGSSRRFRCLSLGLPPHTVPNDVQSELIGTQTSQKDGWNKGQQEAHHRIY